MHVACEELIGHLKISLKKIKKDYVTEILNALFEEIERNYEASKELSSYLSDMKYYIADHSEDFLPDPVSEAGSEGEEYEERFRRK